MWPAQRRGSGTQFVVAGLPIARVSAGPLNHAKLKQSDAAAGAAGDAADPGTHLPRQHAGEGKLLSLFEPSTEIIRKGKAGKPNEFGKMVKLQEAENQIVIDYEVYDQRPNDSDLLIRGHRNPRGEARTHAAPGGGGRCVLLRQERGGGESERRQTRLHSQSQSTKSAERKREQKKRWFRNGQKWRTGCEGRISVVKRRHGLDRCRYKGSCGMKRWVGLGVIADNLINIGRVMEKQSRQR